MRLLRDLWATSASRTAAVGLLMLAWAAGQAGAAALTGQVLVDRSRPAFLVLVVALTAAVLSALPPRAGPRRPVPPRLPGARRRADGRRPLRPRPRAARGPADRRLVGGPAST